MTRKLKTGLDELEEFCRERLVLENGEPMELYEFQRRMLADFFAGVTETLVIIPKKNGKTTLLAALALFRLVTTLDFDIAVVASSREQAMVLYDQARGFVQRSGWLQDRCKVLRGYREIRRKDPERPDNPKEFRGLLKVYAADEDTVDGWLGNLALVDELHRHKTADLYGVLRDGLSGRDGQMVTISTAGDTHDTPLGELRKNAYAGQVQRDGVYRYVRSGGFCLHEWALEPTDDLEDLELVKQANPAPWQTVDKLRARFESPSMTRGQWARFAAGVWGIGSDPAFDRDAWGALATGKRIEKGRFVTLGFDGARRRDSTALIACDIETGHLQVAGFWPRPADADEDWEQPESEVDEALAEAFDHWEVWRLYADPPYWESAVDRWERDYGKTRVVPWWTNRVKQTALALLAFKGDMAPGRMSHDGDEALAEHIGNAVRKPTRMLEGDEELWLIRKDSKDSPRKIDLAMAACLAWEARRDAIVAGAKPPRRARAYGFH